MKPRNIRQEKGITLIALVITIIVMLILVTVTISIAINSGLFNHAKNASSLYDIAKIKEEFQAGIYAVQMEYYKNGEEGSLRDYIFSEEPGEGQEILSTELGARNLSFDAENSQITYKGVIFEIGENGEITVVGGNVNPEANNNENNDDSKESEFADALATGEYEYATNTDNSIKYYSPDLTGFNGKQTYYVVYDASGNESIPGRCDLMAPSEVTGWYDYENKKWANIVTVNDNSITYWTWIPRYMYNVDGTTEEVYFVDLNNDCTLKKDGTESTFKPDEIDGKNFEISDAFKFGDEKLKGYWISKYEVQFDSANDNYRIITEENGTDVKLSTLTAGNSYYLYLNGVKQEGTITLPTTIHNINTTKGYQIMLVDTTTGKIRTKTAGEKVRIDLSGFDPEKTFYVEYDKSSGEEIIEKTHIQIDSEGRPTNAPDEWYDYDNKKWANIVTVNDSLITYWTYIPRYEYRVVPGVDKLDIRFINIETEPHEGYQISDAFTFDGKPINGYWISKYEMQYEFNSNRVIAEASGNKIKINTAQATTGPFLLYINGVKQTGEVTSLPTEISADTSRDNFIMLINKTDGKILTTTVSKTIQIDLSGFDSSCTYYVEYDLTTGEEKTGNKTAIQVNADGSPANAPTNWYDYTNKRWANIMTNNDGLITYWTYIPRYEYRVLPGLDKLDINFINIGTAPHEGYQIPDSFTFDGKALKGYWISKYEVQEKTD